MERNGSELSRVLYPRGATVLAATCAVLFIIIGVIGNLVTIVALLRSRRLMAHATTWFILSLCFSDLLFCLINLPISASRYIYEAWILGETLCRIFPFFFYGNVATSLLSLVAITVNRYVLISHYTTYDKIYQKKWISTMIAFVWTFSFAMLLPTMYEVWGKFGLNESTFSCTILKKDGKSPKKFLFIFGILLPCLVIVICYTRIFFKVRQSHQRVTQNRNNVSRDCTSNSTGNHTSSSPSSKRNDLRLTKMMLLIFCCFLICFLPLLIFNVRDASILASILAWASSVINPFIYAMTNSQYRQAYWQLFAGSRPNHGSGSGGRSFVTEMVPVHNNKFEKQKPKNHNRARVNKNQFA